MFDLISVYHRDAAYDDFRALSATIEAFETTVPYQMIGVDNRVKNVGFAKGCNQGAAAGISPYLGFVNPDAIVYGPFLQRVLDVFEDPEIVITGERFGKQPTEFQRVWGCNDWVCGAAMFVRRDFFESVQGFDEQFIMYFEETDLIRRAQVAGKLVKSVELPIMHDSPKWDPPEDVTYKRHHFDRSAVRFNKKWPRGRTRP